MFEKISKAFQQKLNCVEALALNDYISFVIFTLLVSAFGLFEQISGMRGGPKLG